MNTERGLGVSSRLAISGWFLLNGFVVASWVAHIPRQATALEIPPDTLGLVLLGMAVGSILGMTAAPAAIRRFGPGRAAWVAGVVFALLIPLPLLAGSVVALGLSLVLLGILHGFLDVTMNAAAAICERHLGRPVMSAFHGWFSLGMVAGVTAGSAALAVGLAPAGHAAVVAGLGVTLMMMCRPAASSKSDAPVVTRVEHHDSVNHRAYALAAIAFVCLFLEGAMADWAGLLAVTFGAGPSVAPLAYAAFTVAWAGGRFLGDRLTASVGDMMIVRAGGLLAAAGVGFALLIGSPVGVAVGCAITGLGLANAVPVLFRAAAGTDPAGRGLALVTGIGYAGFLVGPPLVGFTAAAVGLPRAMLLVVVSGVLLSLGAVALRRRPKATVTKQIGIDCRAILFDMDGTLVDSTLACETLWREWAARAGVDPAPILAIHHGRRPEETLRLTYPEHATAEAAGWIQQHQIGVIDGLKPVVGAAELLDSLADRPWAVVTSASRALAESRLRAVGLWRGVLLIGADDVAEGKPSPEGYLAAARALGVQPGECVVVEDAPAGVEAGKRAGMAVVAVTTTHAPTALATPHVVRDLAGVSATPDAEGIIRLALTW
ncbi:HAD-IA family hydrolase [Zavarzinella formosa]|uniref:HAD-IA family hydrolase n=1 Tax=Zavarzinella formosa TaxID=360055 RepID=UPI00030FEE62|nr:HAD-IA family hydrolase [Zavarzinella formosa]